MSDVDDALAATDRIGSYKQPTVGEWAAIRLAEEVRTLRARVAELEAERSGMRATEWGVRWPIGGVQEWGQNEQGARMRATWTDLPGELVNRTAPGRWTPVSL